MSWRAEFDESDDFNAAPTRAEQGSDGFKPQQQAIPSRADATDDD